MTVTSASSTRRRVLQVGIGAVLGGLAGCASNQSAVSGTSEETGPNSKTVGVDPDGRYVFTPGTEKPLPSNYWNDDGVRMGN